ncbi:MAG: hypothetical protein KAS39_02945, partial [Actinomycetia bacterium]|nr:hypothetical protein [Actinomycetes bacterium]
QKVGEITLTIEKVENDNGGVKVYWRGHQPYKDEGRTYSSIVGFDPRPLIEIRGLPESGMRIYDLYKDEFFPSEGWVNEPNEKGESTGVMFFPGIEKDRVKRITVTNVILDLPVEAGFNIPLPQGREGEVIIGEEKDIRNCTVRIEKVVFSKDETKVQFSTFPKDDENFRFMTLSGVFLHGEKDYDFFKAEENSFTYQPVIEEAEIEVIVKKAQYLVSGFWDWEL